MLGRRQTAGVTTSLDVDLGSVDNVLRAARRKVRKQAKKGVEQAGQREVLPRVRALTAGEYPSGVLTALTVKARGQTAFLTTRGARKWDRIAGLLNFGGVVSVQIRPVKKQALTVGDTGEIRASVSAPREYSGKHRFEEGVAASLSQFEETLLYYVMQAFDGLPHSP